MHRGKKKNQNKSSKSKTQTEMIPEVVSDFAPMAFRAEVVISFECVGPQSRGSMPWYPILHLGLQTGYVCVRRWRRNGCLGFAWCFFLPSIILDISSCFVLIFSSLTRGSGSAKAEGGGSQKEAVVGQGAATGGRMGRLRLAQAVPIREREGLLRVGVESSKSPQP